MTISSSRRLFRHLAAIAVAIVVASTGARTQEPPDLTIPAGARVFVAPMDGFGTYVAAAVIEKKVPVAVVKDRSQADFEIDGGAESSKPGWARIIFLQQTATD